MATETPYLRYTPAVEIPEADEAETSRALNETMRSISEKTLADGGHAIRSVHAKAHGALRAELEVATDLSPELAQGLFAKPGRYPVVMRFSTIPGDILDDSVSTPRGVAIKVLGVEGERLEGSEGDATQDFVLVNGPTFSAPGPKPFLATLKLLAKTTDRAEGLKKAASAALRGVQSAVVATTGSPSPTLATLGGQPETHLLGDSFYSQVPLRFGDHIAKISLVPVSPEMRALANKPLDDTSAADAIREAVIEHFRIHGGTWELRAQLCLNLDDMPVEDASVIWPETASPYRTIATLTAAPQASWSEARAAYVDDGLSFSPWHGLAAHRPLGGIMRMRKSAYEMGKRFRAEKNGRRIEEPKNLDALPD
ncbi:catalase family protein [Methylobacterium sp. SD274]|uniref:catalase family protein n=1 Tax=Methylobacterium sp. SD274 TaxID=2782009 RepID=UPI001A960E26|nr:catalase family protein [Methylobacterium sp. SD274]MBO1019473.1 catalase family protein [Methylobacterium sp. SD274]